MVRGTLLGFTFICSLLEMLHCCILLVVIVNIQRFQLALGVIVTKLFIVSAMHISAGS